VHNQHIALTYISAHTNDSLPGFNDKRFFISIKYFLIEQYSIYTTHLSSREKTSSDKANTKLNLHLLVFGNQFYAFLIGLIII